MRALDQVILALTIWRENRSGGQLGMHSVASVILNRAAQRKTSVYYECVRPWQFSSLTAHGDPELAIWPEEKDAFWLAAQEVAVQAATGVLADITHGATMYYAPAGKQWKKRFALPGGKQVAFPDDWNEQSMAFTGLIAEQLFFKAR
ncbi:cell wall hydrolase [Telmatobacter bradus]|uniref:cell wall hydrolase n=1 Tax=Telmatobacter bradus TaxID=474953 RepID=UPI003B42A14B